MADPLKVPLNQSALVWCYTYECNLCTLPAKYAYFFGAKLRKAIDNNIFLIIITGGNLIIIGLDNAGY